MELFFEIAIVIGGAATVLAAAVFFARSLALRSELLTARLLASVERAEPTAPPTREPLLVVDYLNRELLEDIARQKEIQVDSVGWEVGQTESITEELGSEVGAEIAVPGTSLGARKTVREARGQAWQRSRSAERSYNLRAVLNELLEALERDGELRRDLAEVPKAAWLEAVLVGDLMMVWFDWGLDKLGDEDPRKRIAKAIDTVVAEADERVGVAKAEELQAAVPSRGEIHFAMIETEWAISAEGDQLLLSSEWLVDTTKPGERPEERVIIPGLLEVPLDPAKLIGLGPQRLKPGSSRWLRVFGKIEMFEDGALQILPILVAAV